MPVKIEISGPAVAAFVIFAVAGGAAWYVFNKPILSIPFLVIGVYLLFSIRVVRQWEKVGVLRFGKFLRLQGPGLFMLVPVIDTLSPFVDQRVRTSMVTAESTLSCDTVPVNVDAIVFWLVWDAQKSILEVANYENAITLSAQTALRESIGRHQLAEMIMNRDTLGHELQKVLDQKTNPWGITVQSVEIRDVRIPQALENAMSQQAQAERERQARVILGDAELQVTAKFAEAASVYEESPTALHLRAMNMLYEAIKERGSMVIVPSSAVETMGLGGMLGVSAARKDA
jgi:regulator of protease activity HflC (stomatin/prohibitin superfamily)